MSPNFTIDGSNIATGELGYDRPLYNRLLSMTDDMLGPIPCISSMCHIYMTDFAYDRPIFLVPLSLPYPSSLVLYVLFFFVCTRCDM